MSLSKDYKESIKYKLKTIDYHIGNCLKIARSQEINEKNIVAITAELDAIMVAYQSCLDYLARLIKRERNLPKDRSRFYFTDLHCRLSSYGEKTTDLADEIRSLFKKSQYLRDFSNTIKHEKVIYQSNKQVKINDSTVYNLIEIDSFQKNKKEEYNSITLEGFIYYFIKTLRQDIVTLMNKV